MSQEDDSIVTAITPFTIQDYPNHLACIFWIAGCNFRCVYCHNPSLVEGIFNYISKKKVAGFLQSRIGLLDGIVFSGGECTLNPRLLNFISDIRKNFFGYKIKIDTNGSNPDVLRELINLSYVDFIAIDYKATTQKYSLITKSNNDNVIKSIKLIVNSKIEKEIRITVHTSFLDENDVNLMLDELIEIGYDGDVFLQNVITTNETLMNVSSQSRVLDLKKILNKKKINIFTRNF